MLQFGSFTSKIICQKKNKCNTFIHCHFGSDVPYSEFVIPIRGKIITDHTVRSLFHRYKLKSAAWKLHVTLERQQRKKVILQKHHRFKNAFISVNRELKW